MTSHCVLVGSIPFNTIHTPDLRSFFSSWTETSRFVSFHYKRRLDVFTSPGKSHPGNYTCCIVSLSSQSDVDEFISSFCGKQWTTIDGTALADACSIIKIKDPILSGISSSSSSSSAKKYLTNKEKRREKREAIRTLESLPELEQALPVGLKQGNVGTPTKDIIAAVDSCIIPSSALSKLGVSLSISSLKKSSANIPFNYSNPSSSIAPDIESSFLEHAEESSGSDEEYGAEDWERAAAFQDPKFHSYDRIETGPEYLHEEYVEKTWEKGGSGLVFYTDEAHWRGQLHEDADMHRPEEHQYDDFDVDTSRYYDKTRGNDDERLYGATAVPNALEREEEWDRRGHDLGVGVVVQKRERERQEEPKDDDRESVSFQDLKSSAAAAAAATGPYQSKKQKLSVSTHARQLKQSIFESKDDQFYFSHSLRTVAPIDGSDQSSFLSKRIEDPSDAILKAELANAKQFEKQVLHGLPGRMMEKMGWKAGRGLGSKESGIRQPVHLDAQTSKAGVGYQEPAGSSKRSRARRRSKSPDDGASGVMMISSVYDKPNPNGLSIDSKVPPDDAWLPSISSSFQKSGVF